MWLCPPSYKEGRRAGPQGCRIPKGVCTAWDLQIQERSQGLQALQLATFGCRPSGTPPGPLPCSLPSEMDTVSVLPYVDLFHQPVLLHSSEKQPLSVTSNLITKDAAFTSLNHPRIRIQTSWRRSLSPLLPTPTHFQTQASPMKWTHRPPPAGLGL